MKEERLMFDIFIEIQFDDKPTKIVYKAVVHENLLLIQHVTVIDSDSDLGMLDLESSLYGGPRYESLSRVSVSPTLLNFLTLAGSQKTTWKLFGQGLAAK